MGAAIDRIVRGAALDRILIRTAINQVLGTVAHKAVGALIAVQGVAAAAAVDGVVAQAPADRIRTGLAEKLVILGPAVDDVVEGATIDRVGALVPEQAVVLVVAIDQVVVRAAIDRVVRGAAGDRVVLGAAVNQIGAAVADDGIGPFPALDRIRAAAAVEVVVAGPTDQRVVAALAQKAIGAVVAVEQIAQRAALDRIVAGVAADRVAVGAAGDGIVAVAAIGGRAAPVEGIGGLAIGRLQDQVAGGVAEQRAVKSPEQRRRGIDADADMQAQGLPGGQGRRIGKVIEGADLVLQAPVAQLRGAAAGVGDLDPFAVGVGVVRARHVVVDGGDRKLGAEQRRAGEGIFEPADDAAGVGAAQFHVVGVVGEGVQRAVGIAVQPGIDAVAQIDAYPRARRQHVAGIEGIGGAVGIDLVAVQRHDLRRDVDDVDPLAVRVVLVDAGGVVVDGQLDRRAHALRGRRGGAPAVRFHEVADGRAQVHRQIARGRKHAGCAAPIQRVGGVDARPHADRDHVAGVQRPVFQEDELPVAHRKLPVRQVLDGRAGVADGQELARRIARSVARQDPVDDDAVIGDVGFGVGPLVAQDGDVGTVDQIDQTIGIVEDGGGIAPEQRGRRIGAAAHHDANIGVGRQREPVREGIGDPARDQPVSAEVDRGIRGVVKRHPFLVGRIRGCPLAVEMRDHADCAARAFAFGGFRAPGIGVHGMRARRPDFQRAEIVVQDAGGIAPVAHAVAVDARSDEDAQGLAGLQHLAILEDIVVAVVLQAPAGQVHRRRPGVADHHEFAVRVGRIVGAGGVELHIVDDDGRHRPVQRGGGPELMTADVQMFVAQIEHVAAVDEQRRVVAQIHRIGGVDAASDIDAEILARVQDRRGQRDGRRFSVQTDRPAGQVQILRAVVLDVDVFVVQIQEIVARGVEIDIHQHVRPGRRVPARGARFPHAGLGDARDLAGGEVFVAIVGFEFIADGQTQAFLDQDRRDVDAVDEDMAHRPAKAAGIFVLRLQDDARADGQQFRQTQRRLIRKGLVQGLFVGVHPGHADPVRQVLRREISVVPDHIERVAIDDMGDGRAPGLQRHGRSFLE